jgi:nicotinamidase-related amidase
MSTLSDRSGTALLVVDVQNGVVGDAYDRDGVVSRIGELVDRAHREDVPIVWVQHAEDGELEPGSPAWEIVPELAPADEEDRVQKRHGDSFEGTDLETVLARLGVARLVVAGAETDACIRSTIHGAFARGYDTVLVSDAHTATDKTSWGAPPVPDVIRHTNLYWTYQSAPGKTAGTATAAEVPLRV